MQQCSGAAVLLCSCQGQGRDHLLLGSVHTFLKTRPDLDDLGTHHNLVTRSHPPFLTQNSVLCTMYKNAIRPTAYAAGHVAATCSSTRAIIHIQYQPSSSPPTACSRPIHADALVETRGPEAMGSPTPRFHQRCQVKTKLFAKQGVLRTSLVARSSTCRAAWYCTPSKVEAL